MNKKLQAAVDEVIRELHERYPGVELAVYQQERKSAYVYVTPPENSVWDGEGVWDLLEEMSPRQADRLIETGYHVLLLPRFRQPPTVNVARLRERAAQWQAHATDEEEPTT